MSGGLSCETWIGTQLSMYESALGLCFLLLLLLSLILFAETSELQAHFYLTICWINCDFGTRPVFFIL